MEEPEVDQTESSPALLLVLTSMWVVVWFVRKKKKKKKIAQKRSEKMQNHIKTFHLIYHDILASSIAGK